MIFKDEDRHSKIEQSARPERYTATFVASFLRQYALLSLPLSLSFSVHRWAVFLGSRNQEAKVMSNVRIIVLSLPPGYEGCGNPPPPPIHADISFYNSIMYRLKIRFLA